MPGYFGAIVLLVLVFLRKTRYPSWTVLANPAVLMLLSPLVDVVPAPMGAVVSGGFTNLSVAIFFGISVLTTWRCAEDPAQETAG